jgi:hypothetical protein
MDNFIKGLDIIELEREPIYSRYGIYSATDNWHIFKDICEKLGINHEQYEDDLARGEVVVTPPNNGYYTIYWCRDRYKLLQFTQKMCM